MPWSKLENIILVILVLTNLCLLVSVMGQRLHSSALRSQARDNAVRFLQSRGVQLEESLVPQTVSLLPQLVERDLEGEAACAAALLQGAVRAEARGGEVYRYDNENGAVQFHSDGVFSAELAPGVFPVGEEPEKTCLELLSWLGFQGELLGREGEEFTFRQLWEGDPVFNQQVTVRCRKGYVHSMTGGRRLVGAPQGDPSRTVITPATALIELFNGVTALGDVCSRVDRIEEGYVSAASLSGPMTLTPVWRVTTDTGAYQVDAVTGGVSRVP